MSLLLIPGTSSLPDCSRSCLLAGREDLELLAFGGNPNLCLPSVTNETTECRAMSTAVCKDLVLHHPAASLTPEGMDRGIRHNLLKTSCMSRLSCLVPAERSLK